MRLNEFVFQRINEGGNIFKDETGEVITTNINRSDIAPTIEWLEKITKLPLIDNTLGSVGKKEHSGDLDIAVDENVISKDELVSHLVKWAKSQNVPDDQIINKKPFKGGWLDKTGISVHFKTPIRGNAANGYAQTDFMFTDDLAWMKFAMFSAGDASKFSGADRNLLMSSTAKSLPGDFKYSWQKGLIKRSTGEMISKNPDEIAMVLLGKGHKGSDLDSVETIMAAISKDSTRFNQLKNLPAKLRDTEGKKTGEIKADAEEADRIERAMQG
jgi:hypothetical protein